MNGCTALTSSPHHLRQLAGPAPGEPADRHPPQPRGQLPAERQLHLAVEQVPDPGRRGREQQPDEQADRARDHDDPDVTVVDRAGRQQSAPQLDDRQQRRQPRDGADDLQDHHGGETPRSAGAAAPSCSVPPVGGGHPIACCLRADSASSMGWCCGCPEASSLFHRTRFIATDSCRLPSARVMDIVAAPQTVPSWPQKVPHPGTLDLVQTEAVVDRLPVQGDDRDRALHLRQR